jgi:phospholipase/carboxylesterase
MTDETHTDGRLLTRPGKPSGDPPVGLRLLERDGIRGGYLYVPAGYREERPAPLVVLLHGAGEDGRDGLAQLREHADAAGLILLALTSRGPTWDLVLGRGRYGSDVVSLDLALERTFSSCAVDPGRIAIAGYSDGASYALSLGLTNGDLFTHVIAFSPGFMVPARREGRPRVFVSHGEHDRWLPIDLCSRRIVPDLQRMGYDVRYREFGGGHVVSPVIAREAADWLTAR